MIDKTSKAIKYPLFLKIIQIQNYITVIGSLSLSGISFFASKSFLLETNGGIEPINRYLVGAAYLTVSLIVIYVLYKIRIRNRYAPEIYVISNVTAFAIFEIINHFNNYRPSMTEYIVVYIGEAAFMTYLLLNVNVRKYLSNKWFGHSHCHQYKKQIIYHR